MQDNPFTSFKRLAFLENLHTKHPIFEEHQEETMNSKTLFLDRQVHQSWAQCLKTTQKSLIFKLFFSIFG